MRLANGIRARIPSSSAPKTKSLSRKASLCHPSNVRHPMLLPDKLFVLTVVAGDLQQMAGPNDPSCAGSRSLSSRKVFDEKKKSATLAVPATFLAAKGAFPLASSVLTPETLQRPAPSLALLLPQSISSRLTRTVGGGGGGGGGAMDSLVVVVLLDPTASDCPGGGGRLRRRLEPPAESTFGVCPVAAVASCCVRSVPASPCKLACPFARVPAPTSASAGDVEGASGSRPS